MNRLVVSTTNGKVATQEKVHRSAIAALVTLHDTTSIAHTVGLQNVSSNEATVSERVE